MALLFADSFDHYATADLTAKWTTLSSGTGTLGIAPTTGRRSSGCLDTTTVSTGKQLAKTLFPATPTQFVIGGAFNFNRRESAAFLFVVTEPDNTVQLGCCTNADGTLFVSLGGTFDPTSGLSSVGTNISGNSAVALQVGVYSYVELKGTIHDSAGSYEVRINGVSVLSGTGVDTRNGGTGNWSQVKVTARRAAFNVGVDFLLDDFYVLDLATPSDWISGSKNNDFLGDVRIDCRYPTAEGATIDWTPSTGTDNSALVDEHAPNSDTDYVTVTVAPATDTYVIQDAAISDPIIGAQVCIFAKKADAGEATLRSVCRPVSTDFLGAAALAPSNAVYFYQLQPMDVNPATGARFTEAEFNAAQFGVKKTA